MKIPDDFESCLLPAEAVVTHDGVTQALPTRKRILGSQSAALRRTSGRHQPGWPKPVRAVWRVDDSDDEHQSAKRGRITQVNLRKLRHGRWREIARRRLAGFDREDLAESRSIMPPTSLPAPGPLTLEQRIQNLESLASVNNIGVTPTTIFNANGEVTPPLLEWNGSPPDRSAPADYCWRVYPA